MLAWLSEWGADLHIAQQMPLPLTISCSSKSRLDLTFLVLPFWYLLTQVDPDIFQTSSKTVVCVCVSKRGGGRTRSREVLVLLLNITGRQRWKFSDLYVDFMSTKLFSGDWPKT